MIWDIIPPSDTKLHFIIILYDRNLVTHKISAPYRNLTLPN